MPTAIDLFEKARHHERVEQLQAARDNDLMPYFQGARGPAGPVVTMEGHERIMLGSNNYLGLTGDARVKDAARDALERYGTGLTGSRLNGTSRSTRELESRLAEWMGPRTRSCSPATSRTPARSARCSARATRDLRLGDHASILDAVSMSRAHPPVPLQPARQARDDAPAAESDGGGVLVVVDGVFSMEGDIAPVPEIGALPRARRAADDRRGPRRGVLGARSAAPAS